MTQDTLFQAEKVAAGLPELLLQAEKVAQTFRRGLHGKRRAGMGEGFWQFRTYQQGDSVRDVDWRQTAKREEAYIRQRELETAQTLWLYRDDSASMRFRSSGKLPYKKEYAEVLLLALAILAIEGGERVGLIGASLRPQTALASMPTLAAHLQEPVNSVFLQKPVPQHALVVLIGDFYQPLADVEAMCKALTARGARGVMIQVADPAERDLTWEGRVRFLDIENENATATIDQVEDIRAAYKERFDAHVQGLAAIARAHGFVFEAASTQAPPEKVLENIYVSLGARV